MAANKPPGAAERRSLYRDSAGRVRSFPDLKIDGLFNDMTECDKDFRQLLITAEKWTDRLDSLAIKQRCLRRGFARLNETVDTMRDEARQVDKSCGKLETRLAENFIVGVPSTEDEWQRVLDRECLLQTAVARLEQQKPKDFYYSDDDTSQSSDTPTFDSRLGMDAMTTDDRSGSRSGNISPAESETISVYITLSSCWTSVGNLTSDEDVDGDDLQLEECLRIAALNSQLEESAVLSDLDDTGFQSETTGDYSSAAESMQQQPPSCNDCCSAEYNAMRSKSL